jgi:hypothetical protein
MEAVLYILSGITVYAGVHHLYLATVDTSTRPHVQLGLLYFLLAGFAFASALTYHAVEITALLSAGKFSVSMGILLWCALLWYVAFHTRFKPLLILDALTAVWLIFLIRNISSPHSLLYSDVAQVNQTLPSGETLALVHSSLSPWWTAMEVAILASLLFCLYASYKFFKDDASNKLPAMTLGGGLLLLLLVTISDHLVITGTIQGIYLAPFGFLGFLLSNSVYPVLQSFYAKRHANKPQVIYNLTFEPGQASFHSDVSELKTPSCEELEINVPASAHDTESGGVTEHAFGLAVEEESADALSAKAVAAHGPEETGHPAGKEKSAKTGKPREPQLDQITLHTISDNLIDIAVYATMAMNRFKRGDADPQVLENLCKKVRSQSIKTRRLINQYTDSEKRSDITTD